MHSIKSSIDKYIYVTSLAYYSFDKTEGSVDTQHTLHTDQEPEHIPNHPGYRTELLTHILKPDCIFGKNRVRESPKPKDRLKHTTNGPLVSVQIMDLTSGIDFELEATPICKQAKYSNAATNIHRDSGKLDTALPYPMDFANMSTEQQTKWETDSYIRLDTTLGGTASCKVKKVGWAAIDLPAIVTIGMRGPMPTRNAELHTALRILRTVHKQLNIDIHDLAVKHTQIIFDTQHEIRREKGFALRRVY